MQGWVAVASSSSRASVRHTPADVNGNLIARHEGKELIGLNAWQEALKRDLHSVEHSPNYGLTLLELAVSSEQRPLTIQDFILPKDSSLRGKGENGSDVGVRWERHIDP